MENDYVTLPAVWLECTTVTVPFISLYCHHIIREKLSCPHLRLMLACMGMAPSIGENPWNWKYFLNYLPKRSDSHRSKLRTSEVFFRPSIAATTMSGAHSIWILQNWIFDILFCNMHAWIDIWFGILGKLKEKWSREWLACPSQLHDACKLLDITNGTA